VPISFIYLLSGDRATTFTHSETKELEGLYGQATKGSTKGGTAKKNDILAVVG